ncbi:MAG: FmdB family zinc ribbon protein, partial [Gemmatimonadota bacterium]
HTFELFQRMSDAPAADCPECGKPAERLLSAGAGFLFKGSGFYITDYRSDSYRKKAESETKATNGGGGDGSGSADKGAKKGDGASPPAGKDGTTSGKTKGGGSASGSGSSGSGSGSSGSGASGKGSASSSGSS